MKTITIKNSHLHVFDKVLNYRMPFAKGRLRNRFLNLIKPFYDAREANRLELCKEFAEKDKDGEPVIIDNTYVFPPDSKFNDEYVELYNEDCVIDIPTSMRADIGGIKHLIEFSTAELDSVEQKMAEEILEAMTNPKPEEPDNKETEEEIVEA